VVARREIRIGGDGYGDPTGSVDATDGIRRADAAAARHDCDLVVDGTFRVHCPPPWLGEPRMRAAVQFTAPRVIGERGNARVFLDDDQAPGAPGDVLAAVAFAQHRDGFVIRDVTFDARAAHQPAGFVAHALRLQRCRDSDVTAIVKNAPGNTTKGHGETFHFQDLGGEGGRFSIEAISDDGGPTATGIVVQMRAPDARPWLLHDWHAEGMRGQAVGTFQGGIGAIGPGVARNCGGAGVNIEAGPKGTSAITVGDLRDERATVAVVACDRAVTVNGNAPRGARQVGPVDVSGLVATDCGRGVWLVNEPCGPVRLDRVSIVRPRVAAIDLGGGELAAERAGLLTVGRSRVELDRSSGAVAIKGGPAPSHWALDVVSE
jgi:hypothetical protein